MEFCKDCRFYENRMCTEKNASTTARSVACSRFSRYSDRNPAGLKNCKDCRYYSGGRCLERNFSTNPNSSSCNIGTICK